MNDLEKLYSITDKESINVFENSWSTVPARIFEIENNYIIALAKNKIDNSLQEREVIAEELGHYYCNALYYLGDDKTLKSKCEYRARKWAYSILIPINKLKEKMQHCIDFFELAEYFNVEPEYLNECMKFYIETGMLSFSNCYRKA